MFVLRVRAQLLSHVQLCAIQWTGAHQGPLAMGLFRQEYWSGLPFPPRGDFSDPEIKPANFESPALAGRFFSTEPPGKPRDALINLKSFI